jgi:hypothetical protein
MLNLLRRIASLKFTLAGMVLLGIGAGYSYGNPMGVPVWVLVVPLAWLAINLMAAIATNQRINQQPGLLVFHLSLLSIVLLAGLGRLTHLDAHMELTLGAEFHPERLLEVRAGPLHSGDLDQVHFIQGPYTVEYAPGVRRGLTHDHVKVRNEAGEWIDREIGDDRPLVVKRYRFYTTHNKGFTPILSWIPDDGGKAQTGAVNMPSYPLFDYKQDNQWTTPAGQSVKLWLQLKTGLTEDAAWVLDGNRASGVLVVTTADNERHELTAGESLPLQGGVLRYDALSTWMGYRVFYDPTIHWLFFVAITGVLGLAQYFWRKVNLQPWESPIETGQAVPESTVATTWQNNEPTAAQANTTTAHNNTVSEMTHSITDDNLQPRSAASSRQRA